jgi:hypothetical protein
MNTGSRPYENDNPNHLRRSARGRGADDAVEELNFDDENPPRSGDPVHAAELASELPIEREREGGLSSGELAREARNDSDVTDNDLGPETLYDEEEEYEVYASAPVDKQLRTVRAGEIGGGFGKDEAELARDEHPGP